VYKTLQCGVVHFSHCLWVLKMYRRWTDVFFVCDVVQCISIIIYDVNLYRINVQFGWCLMCNWCARACTYVNTLFCVFVSV